MQSLSVLLISGFLNLIAFSMSFALCGGFVLTSIVVIRYPVQTLKQSALDQNILSSCKGNALMTSVFL